MVEDNEALLSKIAKQTKQADSTSASNTFQNSKIDEKIVSAIVNKNFFEPLANFNSMQTSNEETSLSQLLIISKIMVRLLEIMINLRQFPCPPPPNWKEILTKLTLILTPKFRKELSVIQLNPSLKFDEYRIIQTYFPGSQSEYHSVHMKFLGSRKIANILTSKHLNFKVHTVY